MKLWKNYEDRDHRQPSQRFDVVVVDELLAEVAQEGQWNDDRNGPTQLPANEPEIALRPFEVDGAHASLTTELADALDGEVDECNPLHGDGAGGNQLRWIGHEAQPVCR